MANSIIPKKITKDQAKDTGMAMVFILILVGYFKEDFRCISAAGVFLLLNMISPNMYKPVAKIWLGLSNLLGTIMSKVVLTLIFLSVVTPVGMIRNILNADPMQLKKWKNGTSSVFINRDHVFEAKDIERTY